MKPTKKNNLMLYTFTLPYFIALILMLTTFSYKTGQLLSHDQKTVPAGTVLGAHTNVIKVDNPVYVTNQEKYVEPVLETTETSATDESVSVDSTDPTEQETVRNSNGSFTIIEKVTIDGTTKTKVTERAATGEVLSEKYIDEEK
jgi:hypothetical protein